MMKSVNEITLNSYDKNEAGIHDADSSLGIRLCCSEPCTASSTTIECSSYLLLSSSFKGDVDNFIRSLKVINANMAMLTVAWNSLEAASNNLMKFLAPQRPSIVLERFNEIPGILSGATSLLFRKLRVQLNQIKKRSSDELADSTMLDKIAAIQSSWMKSLKDYQIAGLSIGIERVSLNINSDSGLKAFAQLNLLESRLGSVAVSLLRIKHHFIVMQNCASRAESLVDESVVEGLVGLKEICEAARKEADQCCNTVQTLCSILVEFLDAFN